MGETVSYDFDRMIDRRGTLCEKYDFVEKYVGAADVLPMWVADMDFATPDFILDALRKRLEHPILGYTEPGDGFYEAVTGWFGRRHLWETQREWYTFTPGVVTGLNLAIQAFSEEGDGVILQSPVYFPFFSAVKKNNRKLLDNQLVFNNGRYEIDFDDLEAKAKEAKLLLLCNPQNPTGRVFSKWELDRIAEIAEEHDLTIISDEIHCDIVYAPNRHIPIASLSEDAQARTITLIAPSKTFNVAGLNTSLAVIPNPERKKRFDKVCEQVHTGVPTIFGMVALEAAFANGDAWVDALLAYLKTAVDRVDEFLKAEAPRVKLIYPESTFLLWLDFRNLGLHPKELKALMVEKAKLGFNEGRIFGPSGGGFMRMNIGTPRSNVDEALNRILEVVN